MSKQILVIAAPNLVLLGSQVLGKQPTGQRGRRGQGSSTLGSRRLDTMRILSLLSRVTARAPRFVGMKADAVVLTVANVQLRPIFSPASRSWNNQAGTTVPCDVCLSW